jgi:hypothetical protein
MLPLFLLRNIANQALDGHSLPCPAPLVKAQFEFLQVAIRSFIAKRRAVDRLPIHYATQQRSGLGSAVRTENLLEEFAFDFPCLIFAKTPFPCRIHIQESSVKIERRDHLARVLENIPITFSRFALPLVFPDGRALIESHGDKSRRFAILVAKR